MNNISHDIIFIARPDCVYTLIDDEAIIMDADDQVYAVNSIAIELWQLLEKSATISMMHDYITKNYDVDSSLCLQDLKVILGEFIKQNLVTPMES